MIKSVDFPSKIFTTKDELFTELKVNKDAIIDLKKSNSKTSEPFTNQIATSKTATKGIDLKDNSIVAVINTSNYLDSHSDVHIGNIWAKSVKEQQNKIYYVVGHDLTNLSNIIAFPKDVNVSVEEIAWKDLGANYAGTTNALLFEVNKDKIRLKDVQDVISEKVDIEHSVRMQYVKVELCINSEDKDFTEEKSNFDKYINEVANKDKALAEGYFWAVLEAKIYKEGSMVISGSNDITPLLQKDIEAVNNTSKDEPSNDTQNDYYFSLI